MTLRTILFITIIWVGSDSFAQGNQQFIQDPSQYGKVLEANTGMDIQGSPYYLESWSMALASVVKGGATLSLPRVRYNVLNEQLEFDSQGKIMVLNQAMFSQFILISGPDSIEFRNKFESIKSILPTTYLNVAYEGKNLWLIRPVKTLVNDPEAPYGTTKKKIIQSDEAFFLIKSDKTVLTFKMTTRSLSKTFEIESNKILDFLKVNGYSLEQPRDRKSIFQWLDSQL